MVRTENDTVVVQKIRNVIQDYYKEINECRHDYMSGNRAFQEIQDILGMRWRNGSENQD